MTNGGDQEPDARLEVLKAAVQEGLASGNSGKTVQGIMHEVEVRLRKDGVLPAVDRSRRRLRRQPTSRGT